jgi:hypothetical protein
VAYDRVKPTLNLLSAARGGLCVVYRCPSTQFLENVSSEQVMVMERAKRQSASGCKQILRVSCAGISSYKFVLHFAWLEARMIHSVVTAGGPNYRVVIFRFPEEIYFFSSASRLALMPDQLPFKWTLTSWYPVQWTLTSWYPLQWTLTSWYPVHSIPTAVRSKDVGLRPLECWNRGFESRCWHGNSSLLCIVWVAASATS